MVGRKKFRFGAAAAKAETAKGWADVARQAEDLGYDSLHVDDHFAGVFAAMPAVMAAAAATTSIHVGPLVAGNDFRNPVVLAREAATIDVLSDGRLILGLGAGWRKADYDIAGIEQADGRTRISRLAETVKICRGVWSGEPFSFSGTHYRVGDMTGYPKPVADIPIIIGGGGREILSLAAREADVVGVNPKVVGRGFNPRTRATMTCDFVDQRALWIREAAGVRFDELELQLQVFVAAVTDDPSTIADQLSSSFGLPPEDILASPYCQIGSVEQISDNLQRIRERWGISYIVFREGIFRDGILPMARVVANLSGR